MKVITVSNTGEENTLLDVKDLNVEFRLKNGTVSHLTFAKGHLGLNRQPSGGDIKLGGNPSIVASLPPLGLSIFGTTK